MENIMPNPLLQIEESKLSHYSRSPFVDTIFPRCYRLQFNLQWNTKIP